MREFYNFMSQLIISKLSAILMIKVSSRPVLNAKLSDICIGTSAAPTYLPAYYFENKDQQGESEEFNLIDGGIAANNPVMLLHNNLQNVKFS